MRPPLEQLWEASDFLCSKRLAPFLPELIETLERHDEVTLSAQQRRALLPISPATIDRLLGPVRRQHRRQGIATTSPSLAALRAQVPLRTGNSQTAGGLSHEPRQGETATDPRAAGSGKTRTGIPRTDAG